MVKLLEVTRWKLLQMIQMLKMLWTLKYISNSWSIFFFMDNIHYEFGLRFCNYKSSLLVWEARTDFLSLCLAGEILCLASKKHSTEPSWKGAKVDLRHLLCHHTGLLQGLERPLDNLNSPRGLSKSWPLPQPPLWPAVLSGISAVVCTVAPPWHDNPTPAHPLCPG